MVDWITKNQTAACGVLLKHLHDVNRQRLKIIGICLLTLMLWGSDAPGQAVNGMTMLSNWDDPNLPENSGVVYNDCWGYVDLNNREYAILGSTQGTYIFDITVPTNPVMVTFQAGGSTNSIWRDYKTYRTYLYAVSDQGNGSSLQIFDLAGLPSTVTKVYDSQALFSRAHNIYISETSGRLYVAGVIGVSGQNLMIFDIATNPAAPQQLANIPMTGLFLPLGYVHDIHCHNDTCYTFHGNAGMDVINFASLPSIQLIGRLTAYPDQGYSHSGWVTADNKYAVIADETHGMGLKVMDVSVRPTPAFRSTFRSQLEAPAFTNSIAHNPFVNGNLVYVAYYHDGLQVFDISSKASPTLVMGYDTHPQNADYTGFDGAWGVYPFLPSGNIIVSDTKNGLFVLAPTVLPIELTDFSAQLNLGTVSLEWVTQTERNNRNFAVERSTDGQVWEKVTDVPGAGNSHQMRRYQALDRDPVSGVSYYRLRQTDFDGRESFSEVERISTTQQFQLHALYPVPTAGQPEIFANFSIEHEASLQLRVMDLMGRELYAAANIWDAGNHQWSVPVNELAAGSYRLLITGQDVRIAKQFVVGD